MIILDSPCDRKLDSGHVLYGFVFSQVKLVDDIAGLLQHIQQVCNSSRRGNAEFPISQQYVCMKQRRNLLVNSMFSQYDLSFKVHIGCQSHSSKTENSEFYQDISTIVFIVTHSGQTAERGDEIVEYADVSYLLSVNIFL